MWITKDTRKIFSKMFEDEKTAAAFGKKKKDFIVFRLLWHKHYKEYSWEILPYGEHKLYLTGLKFYKKHRKSKALVKRILRD